MCISRVTVKRTTMRSTDQRINLNSDFTKRNYNRRVFVIRIVSKTKLRCPSFYVS